jgi:hypothetical protein
LNSSTQLRQLHPDATEQALEFHAHIVDQMMRADAPTGIILDFANVVPVEAAWMPMLVCLHPTALETYGTYAVDGEDHCVQCMAAVRLWLPEPHEGLLADPDALFDVEYAFGELLSQLRSKQSQETNARLRCIIGHYESVIDALSDLRTESAAYWNPPAEVEDGGRCGY